jgi:4-hydroxy-3-methylbut-2-enyl diphosphate reductase IspH
VQGEADLRCEWFDGDVRVVGITAGTSTPDEVIDRVEGRIREFERESAVVEIRA